MAEDEDLLELKDGYRVEPALAVIDWQALRALSESDPAAFVALYEMARGNYEQDDVVVTRLQEQEWLDADGLLPPAVKHVVESATVEKNDGALAVGLPVDSDNTAAMALWGVHHIRSQVGLERFAEKVRESHKNSDPGSRR